MKKIILSFAVFMLAMPIMSYCAFPTPYTEEIDITKEDKTFKLKENTLVISAERPIPAMKDFAIRILPKKNNIVSISFDTNMEMNMGKFQKKADKISDKEFKIIQTLPKCPSGKTKWYSKVDISYKSGNKETLYIFYDVK